MEDLQISTIYNWYVPLEVFFVMNMLVVYSWRNACKLFLKGFKRQLVSSHLIYHSFPLWLAQQMSGQVLTWNQWVWTACSWSGGSVWSFLFKMYLLQWSRTLGISKSLPSTNNWMLRTQNLPLKWSDPVKHQQGPGWQPVSKCCCVCLIGSL